MGRREEKREITRQDILSAAMELFSSRGYEQTSVDDIADKANVAKGTFYYHFPAKVDVVRAIQRAALSQAVKKAEGMLESGESATVVLKELFSERALWMESNKELARVIVMERFAHLGSPEKRDQIPPFRQVLMDITSKGQATGEFLSHADSEELAKLLTAVLIQSVSTCIREAWTSSLVSRVNDWLDLVLGGIRAVPENS